MDQRPSCKIMDTVGKQGWSSDQEWRPHRTERGFAKTKTLSARQYYSRKFGTDYDHVC